VGLLIARRHEPARTACWVCFVRNSVTTRKSRQGFPSAALPLRWICIEVCRVERCSDVAALASHWPHCHRCVANLSGQRIPDSRQVVTCGWAVQASFAVLSMGWSMLRQSSPRPREKAKARRATMVEVKLTPSGRGVASLTDRERVPTPAEPERVAPASASRNGPVLRVRCTKDGAGNSVVLIRDDLGGPGMGLPHREALDPRGLAARRGRTRRKLASRASFQPGPRIADRPRRVSRRSANRVSRRIIFTPPFTRTPKEKEKKETLGPKSLIKSLPPAGSAQTPDAPESRLRGTARRTTGI
jgi:hypothetical protein